MENSSEFGKTHDPEKGTGQSRANQRDLGWLAGIIDGEGSIGVTYLRLKRKKAGVQPRFYVGNTSMTLMLKVQRIIEEMTGYRAKIYARDHKTSPIVFMIAFGKQSIVHDVLSAILPDLTCKKTQAQELISFCESRRLARERIGKKRAPCTDEDRQLGPRLKKLRKEEFTYLDGGVETERRTPQSIH